MIRTSLAILAVLGLACVANARETRGEFDILAEAGQSLRGIKPTRCFAPPRSFDVLAHACYTVAAEDVDAVVRRLERQLDHPPLLTHGENWHGHGFGIVPMPDSMRAGFAHRAAPSTIVTVINFTAPSVAKSFTANIQLPQVLELGAAPGFVYVQVMKRMPVFRE